MMNRVEMNEEMMEQVNGGYYLPNSFDDSIYHSVGLNVIHNVWSKDEFISYRTGEHYDMDGADDLVYDKYGDEAAEWDYYVL